MSHLDAPCEHTGGHLLVEAGVLLTVADEVSQFGDQQQVGAVLVQSFHQSLFGPQTTHHHRVVFVQRRQPVQEADKQLDHLNSQSQEVNVRHQVGLLRPPRVCTDLSVADEGRHGGQTGLDALVPRQHVLLVAVQEFVQDPAGTNSQSDELHNNDIIINIMTGLRGQYLRMESWMARSVRFCSIRQTRC